MGALEGLEKRLYLLSNRIRAIDRNLNEEECPYLLRTDEGAICTNDHSIFYDESVPEQLCKIYYNDKREFMETGCGLTYFPQASDEEGVLMKQKYGAILKK